LIQLKGTIRVNALVEVARLMAVKLDPGAAIAGTVPCRPGALVSGVHFDDRSAHKSDQV
jgi:hypothetical protein